MSRDRRPDFINNATGADRLPDDIFLGDITHEASFATRVAPGRHYTYDGRLVQDVGVTPQESGDFNRSNLTGHAVRSIVKGMLMSAPHLITAKTEVKLVELMLQASPTARQIGKVRLLTLFSQFPVTRALSALSVLLNHDGDLEREHNEAWWAWRDHQREPGNPHMRRERFLATQWARKASLALSSTAKANDVRLEMADTTLAPKIEVRETSNDRPLTAERVSRVHEAL